MTTIEVVEKKKQEQKAQVLRLAPISKRQARKEGLPIPSFLAWV
jgi:hypothetical protein